MAKSTALGELPDPFPAAEFDRVLYGGDTALKQPVNTIGDTRSEFGAGLQGAAFRYSAMAEAQVRMETIIQGKAPSIGTPGIQRELGNFVFNAGSVIECAAYANFAAASHYKPVSFQFATDADRQAVSPRALLKRLNQEFPGEAITKFWDATLSSPKFADLALQRNILIHRKSDGLSIMMVGPVLHHVSQRTPATTSSPFDSNLAANGLAERRTYIADFLTEFFTNLTVFFASRGVTI